MDLKLKLWMLVPALATMLGGASRPPVSGPVADGLLAVVVNVNNTTKFADENEARSAVRKLFLCTATEWRDKVEAKPFTPSAGDAAYAVYVGEVLDMSEAELARHWISMKNRHGIAPPKEVSSSRMMLRYVGHHDGGVGIVPLKDTEGSTVKVLFTLQPPSRTAWSRS